MKTEMTEFRWRVGGTLIGLLSPCPALQALKADTEPILPSFRLRATHWRIAGGLRRARAFAHPGDADRSVLLASRLSRHQLDDGERDVVTTAARALPTQGDQALCRGAG